MPSIASDDSVHTHERHAVALLVTPSRLDATLPVHVRASTEWLTEESLAPESLNLFYDLIAVAVLSTYSGNQDLLPDGSIASFWAFFLLFWSLWASQALYDVRFSANDLVHRFAKFVQIVVFAYIGTAAPVWWPGWDRVLPRTQIDDQAYQHLQASQGFTIIAASLAAGRAFLGVQYLYVILLARRSGRPTKTLWVEALACILSAACAIISVSLDSNRSILVRTKLALLYAGTAIELAGYVFVALSRTHTRLSSTRISERINALTLIILGEGFVGFLKAASTRVSNLGARDPWIFVETLFGVTILSFLYHFSMATFDNSQSMGRKRTLGVVLLHLPLHFCLLLLVDALKNLIQALSFYRTVTDLSDTLGILVEDPVAMKARMDNGTLHDKAYFALLNTFGLPLSQSFPMFIDWTASHNQTEENVAIASIQYFAEIYFQLAQQTYNVNPDNETVSSYNTLQGLPTDSNGTALETNFETMSESFAQVYESIGSELFGGVLWLLPTCGGALVVIGVLALLRHPRHTRISVIIDTVNIVMGVAVALLGLLDLGSHSFADIAPTPGHKAKGIAPIFSLITSEIGLVIPVAIYGVLVLFQIAMVTLRWHRHRQGAQKEAAAVTRLQSEKTDSLQNPD